MSFEIIEGSWRNTGGSGYLLGFQNFPGILDDMVLAQNITQSVADEMRQEYDGYQLQIDGYDSVNYFIPGNIEAICLHSETVGGGHCAGLKYAVEEDRRNQGDVWGLWFTTQ